MPLDDHYDSLATISRVVRAGPLIEGERDVQTILSVPVPCTLFVPAGSEESEPGRTDRTATSLCSATDSAGGLVHVVATDELLIVSARQNRADGVGAAAAARWIVEGEPVALGPPGEPPFAFNCSLRQATSES